MAPERLRSHGFALIRPLNPPNIIKSVQTFKVATGILAVDTRKGGEWGDRGKKQRDSLREKIWGAPGSCSKLGGKQKG